MATRRKRSRGGRSGARAGGPPTSNALEWAERLARGEDPPQPTALEWAESLAKRNDAEEPVAPPSPWTTSAGVTGPAAAPSPFGLADKDPDTFGGGFGGGTEGLAAPFGAGAAVDHPPFGGTNPADADAGGDDNASPGWGPVAESEPPARRSRRTRDAKGTKSKDSRRSSRKPDQAERKGPAEPPRDAAGDNALDTARPAGPFGAEPTSTGAGAANPFGAIVPDGGSGTDGGSPLAPGADGTPPGAIDEPARTRSRRSARAEVEPAGGRAKRRSSSGKPGRTPGGAAGADKPSGRSAKSSGRSEESAGKPGKRPRGRAAGGSAKPSATRVRRLLATGLPKFADRPLVLVVAAVVAVVLGLGVGWITNYFGSGKNLPAATPQQCAAAQTAWTKAANAQTGISEDRPASVRSGFIEARDAMASVDVPPAIAEEWAAAYSFYQTVADELEAKEAGDAEGIADAAQVASTKVDTDKMIETSKAITRYVNANCDA